MSEFTKKVIKEAIESNLKAVKSNRPKLLLKNDPELLEKKFIKTNLDIERQLSELVKHYNELLPFVKAIKYQINDITEKTHYCAVYLVLCQAMNYWKSIFLLLKNGESSTIQLTNRAIKEALSLAELFSCEFHNKKDNFLKKWFLGEIIKNKEHRDVIESLVGEIAGNINKDLYRMESHPVHVSYVSVIELISPFTEDYDFEKYTKFQRTFLNFRYLKGSMDRTNIALKYVYNFLLRDKAGCDQLDKILTKFSN